MLSQGRQDSFVRWPCPRADASQLKPSILPAGSLLTRVQLDSQPFSYPSFHPNRTQTISLSLSSPIYIHAVLPCFKITQVTLNDSDDTFMTLIRKMQNSQGHSHATSPHRQRTLKKRPCIPFLYGHGLYPSDLSPPC